MKLYSLKDGLKRARKRAGLTQKGLAEKLQENGIVGHVRTIMNWEQGISEPPLGTLIALAQFYDCDLDYLTGRIDSTTHDLEYIHVQTGLSESAIKKLQTLPPDQQDLFSRLIEHKDFRKAMKQVSDLSDKETINQSLADMIVLHIKKKLDDKKSTLASGNMIEKAMLFTLTNLISGIICDITETET